MPKPVVNRYSLRTTFGVATVEQNLGVRASYSCDAVLAAGMLIADEAGLSQNL